MKSRCAMYNLYICTLYFSDNRFTAGTRSPNEISQELRKWSIVINGRQGYRLRAWHGLESAGQGFMVIDVFLAMDYEAIYEGYLLFKVKQLPWQSARSGRVSFFRRKRQEGYKQLASSPGGIQGADHLMQIDHLQSPDIKTGDDLNAEV